MLCIDEIFFFFGVYDQISHDAELYPTTSFMLWSHISIRVVGNPNRLFVVSGALVVVDAPGVVDAREVVDTP